MPLNQNQDFKAITGVMKNILRERKITYRKLGAQIGLTESGIKKIFAAEDGSYKRLTQIANILGVNLLEVLGEIQQASLENVRFTQSQQNHFLKDPLLFSLYFKLVIERISAEEAKHELEFNDHNFFKYLKMLDDLNLIQLLAQNKIKIPNLKMVKSFGDGPFLSKLYRDWGRELVTELADPKHQSSGQFIVRCLKMKPATYLEFLTRLRELDDEFTRRGIQEMRINLKNLKSMRWISITDQNSFVRGKKAGS